jgi:hypothetical protein
MTTPSLYQKALAQIYKSYSHDVGKALVHMGTIGWLFSALAQVTMIATNKNIEKKEKKFLIPQEIADGAINVGLFFTISKLIKDYADNLVESGKISLETTEQILSKFRNDNQTRSNWVEGIIEKYTESVKNDNTLSAIEKKNILKKSKQYRTLFYEKTIGELEKAAKQSSLASIANKNNKTVNKELLNLLKQGQKEFHGFKNGVGVIAAIGASVLASNIITPVCRNIVANKFQDKYKNKIDRKPVYSYTPPATFNAFKI